MDPIRILSSEFTMKPEHVTNVIRLIDEGNTIPFIARYRKEMTGSCDDQILRALADRLLYIRNLDKRKAEIRESIEAQGKLTGELEKALQGAETLAEAEDIYRPYRPKRRTRAMMACEKGLEPLADQLLRQELRRGSLREAALPFVNPEKGVDDWEAAVAGARDIIAERVSDDASARSQIRRIVRREGSLAAKASGEENPVYAMYAEYAEPVSRIPGHRVLAMNRGEREGALKVSLNLEDGAVLPALRNRFVRPGSISSEAVGEAVDDAWSRLIRPSVEREVRGELTEQAAGQAIDLFALNLRPLLLQPPLRGQVVLGLDPAYRTGCKIAVVDATGKALDTAVVYPTPPQNRVDEAKAKLRQLIERHGVTVIAIGNGTASRESERFVADLIGELPRKVRYVMVNEAGASVYSASKLAAEEFPEFDVTLRSAVSIARRLQDPLAELVKIDPKSIGVGQYQHDMPPARLDAALSAVVEDCVNSVGVDLNTASVPLLSHVAGLSESVAHNIVRLREEQGPFRSRTALKKVPRLGAKAFEQCAGFLRIPGADDVLDNTSVHPESYGAARKLLALCGLKEGGDLGELSRRVAALGEEKAADACGVGVPTLRDMVDGLMRPGRDPRDDRPGPALRADVLELTDLKPGMELEGTVRNVVDFGMFVDIGVHQDGLVHISQLADRYVRHPSELFRVGDAVTVRVLGVDAERKRISLTLRREPGPEKPERNSR